MRVPEDGSETTSRNFVSLVSPADVNEEKKKKIFRHHGRISISCFSVSLKISSFVVGYKNLPTSYINLPVNLFRLVRN